MSQDHMEAFTLNASDGAEIACYRWIPEQVRAIVCLAHGMGEHAQRYDWVAKELNAEGYAVYADDHRGHGVTGERNAGQSHGYMGGDGWNRTLADAYELNQLARARHDGVPLVLLGHSMGSMLSQQYITRYGESIDVLALCGSPGFKGGLLGAIGRVLARIDAKRLGPDQPSELLQKLAFGRNNKPFDVPGATGFEWLTRDVAQMQAYVDDPACGFVLTAGSMLDLYEGARMTQTDACLDRVPKDLPIYVFSGAEDAVHGEQKDLYRMLEAYKAHGFSRVENRWYAGGRHEIFNETNRDEVLADLIAWLNQTLFGEGRDGR